MVWFRLFFESVTSGGKRTRVNLSTQINQPIYVDQSIQVDMPVWVSRKIRVIESSCLTQLTTAIRSMCAIDVLFAVQGDDYTIHDIAGGIPLVHLSAKMLRKFARLPCLRVKKCTKYMGDKVDFLDLVLRRAPKIQTDPLIKCIIERLLLRDLISDHCAVDEFPDCGCERFTANILADNHWSNLLYIDMRPVDCRHIFSEATGAANTLRTHHFVPPWLIEFAMHIENPRVLKMILRLYDYVDPDDFYHSLYDYLEYGWIYKTRYNIFYRHLKFYQFERNKGKDYSISKQRKNEWGDPNAY